MPKKLHRERKESPACIRRLVSRVSTLKTRRHGLFKSLRGIRFIFTRRKQGEWFCTWREDRIDAASATRAAKLERKRKRETQNRDVRFDAVDGDANL